MSFTHTTTRNRINPLAVSTVEQTAAPYVTYDQVALCTDPNCPVCRAQRRDKRHKHHKKHHHHHHRKHKNIWDTFLRTESPSTVSVHSIELDDRRAHYNTHVTERAVVPVDQTERQVVSTRTNRPRNYRDDDEVVRDAWTRNNPNDDEIVCCRAYNGCRCPCWCCIILIVLFVILLIVLIVLLATLL